VESAKAAIISVIIDRDEVAMISPWYAGSFFRGATVTGDKQWRAQLFLKMTLISSQHSS
jgi:hypothetical protein